MLTKKDGRQSRGWRVTKDLVKYLLSHDATNERRKGYLKGVIEHAEERGHTTVREDTVLKESFSVVLLAEKNR